MIWHVGSGMGQAAVCPKVHQPLLIRQAVCCDQRSDGSGCVWLTALPSAPLLLCNSCDGVLPVWLAVPVTDGVAWIDHCCPKHIGLLCVAGCTAAFS